MKKLFKTNYLIKSYIEEEYSKFGTNEYNEEYMNFLWDAKLNLHLKYIIDLCCLIVLIIIILK